jgi:protein SCO1
VRILAAVTSRERQKLVVALGAILAAAVLAGCGGSSGASKSTGASHAKRVSANAKLAAPAEQDPPQPAPNFTLRDSLGHTVSLSQYKGRAVLLTFIYDHCPDVCPLIVSNLHNALAKLGSKANQAQVVAVSVDPKGDTPATVRQFLRRHAMTGKMEYLIGSKKKLTPVWREWGVQVKATPDDREVGHSAFVYGITGSGMVRALYPSNFKPAAVAHDVPILAAG